MNELNILLSPCTNGKQRLNAYNILKIQNQKEGAKQELEIIMSWLNDEIDAIKNDIQEQDIEEGLNKHDDTLDLSLYDYREVRSFIEKRLEELK
jgi:hypothetical protein